MTRIIICRNKQPITTDQLLNIFEIIQEIHRISKSYIYVTVNLPSLSEIFSRLFALPRVLVNLTDSFESIPGISGISNSSNHLPVVRVSSASGYSADFCFLNDSSQNLIPSGDLSAILNCFNDFPCYGIHDQRILTSIVVSPVSC